MTLQVQVGEIAYSPDHRKHTPYRLDWKITTPDIKRIGRSAWCDDSDRLTHFRVDLQRAASDPGRQWDLGTGLPQGLSRPAPRTDPAANRRRPDAAATGAGQVVLVDLIADLRRRWPELPGSTRKSEFDQLTAVAAALLRADTPALDAGQLRLLRDWVRYEATPEPTRAARRRAQDEAAARPVTGAAARRARPRVERARAARRAREDAEAADWCALVARHGLRWYELDEAACRRLMAATGRRVDGTGRVEATTRAHRWAYVKRVVGDAVPAKLPVDPIAAIPAHEQPSTTLTVKPVDARLVVGMSALLAVLDALADVVAEHDASPWHTVRVGAQALAGLRPEEAWAFDPDTDYRPAAAADAWGELDVRRAAPRPGARYTDDGAQVEHRTTKTSVSRTVPVCPRLADLIGAARAHDAAGGRRRPDLADPAERDRGDALLRAALSRARAAGHLLPAGFTGEHLRHSRISLLLATKELPDSLVALWSGHSTWTQKRSYEGVVQTKDLRAELHRHRDQLVPPQYRTQSPGDGADGLAAAVRGLLPAIGTGQLEGDDLAAVLSALVGAQPQHHPGPG